MQEGAYNEITVISRAYHAMTPIQVGRSVPCQYSYTGKAQRKGNILVLEGNIPEERGE